MPGKRRRHRFAETTLDADEQFELALKIRYGIGLERLVGERDAAAMCRTRLGSTARPWEAPAPIPQRPDAEVRAKAAALGLGAGRRGHWLGR